MAVDKFPKICDFFFARKKVMQEVMAEVKRLHEKGEPVTNKRFGQIVKEKWQQLKQEQKKLCS